MNLILNLFIISVTIFNSISLNECAIDKSSYNIFECQAHKLVLISENDVIDNKPLKPEDKKDKAQKDASDKKRAETDAKFYQLRNKRLKDQSGKNTNNNEKIDESKIGDTIEAPEVLKAIQEGIREVIKLSTDSPVNRSSLFYENKYGFVNIKEVSNDVSFNAYSIENFLQLRKLFFVNDNFIKSFNMDAPFEKEDTGHNKFKLFYTADYKFTIKTITYKEQKALTSLLFEFYSHYCTYPDTLIPKIAGLYQIRHKSKDTFFIITQNAYPQPLNINNNKRFYLKGADKEAIIKEEKGDRLLRLLDHNFLEKYPKGLKVPTKLYNSVKVILDNDCKFLQSLGMTNYSLALVTSTAPKPVSPKVGSVQSKVQAIEKNTAVDVTNNFQPKYGLYKIDAKNDSKNFPVYIVFNNVLFKYDFLRQIEHAVKGNLLGKGEKATIQNPGVYAKRFIEFINKSVFSPVA